MKNENIEKAVNKVVTALKEGNTETIAYAVFKTVYGRPSDGWSFLNRLTMLMSSTKDARGFNQWKKCSRHVKKGAKAIYILAPITFKAKRTNAETGEEEEVAVRWFKAVPVFRVEDTEGEPLKEDKFEAKIPVNVEKVAEGLGLKIKTKGFNGGAYGYFSPSQKEIALMSPELTVFLHELAHAVDNEINGKLKGGQHVDQEVVAELSAEVVSYLMGYKLNGRSRDYIDRYTRKEWKKVFSVLNRVNNVVAYITEKAKIDSLELEVRGKLDMLQGAEIKAAAAVG